MSEFYPLPSASFETLTPSEGRPATLPEARQLTSNPLDYKLNASTSVTPGHPVDQGMALSMSVRKGALTSAPEVGNELHKVRIGQVDTGASVNNAVMSAYPLSRYVEDGDVEIDSITYEEVPHGGLKTRVNYFNRVTNAKGST